MVGLTLKAALVRLAALAPFCFAYFQPFSPWLRLTALLTPALWVLLVCPARVRYGRQAAVLAGNASPDERPWQDACKGRIRLMRWWALPLCVLLVFLLLLLWLTDAFSALYVIVSVFGGIATAMGVMANAVTRLLSGEALVQPAGVPGGIAMLIVILLICLALFGWGAFQTSLYRFGYTAGAPGADRMKPLRKQNLRLWLPTLGLALLLAVFSYQELGLVLANLLSVAPVFPVKLQWYQTALMALTAISYLVLLPARRLNTAAWAAGIRKEISPDDGAQKPQKQ